MLAPTGLSPHTRGNRGTAHHWAAGIGSIPAHTGKPSKPYSQPGNPGVYPRTHGETVVMDVALPSAQGLSPHTRGNRQLSPSGSSPEGSIPAHTGKPGRIAFCSPFFGVYPRTHGETLSVFTRTDISRGLSPHTRGNRRKPGRWSARSGSIPAHTGKPYNRMRKNNLIEVYPRTHGETSEASTTDTLDWGLSPHTRGNRPGFLRAVWRGGSIPAHTGKPHRHPSRPATEKVYPRTHGET